MTSRSRWPVTHEWVFSGLVCTLCLLHIFELSWVLVHMLQFLFRLKLKGTQNCNFHLMSKKKIATFFLDYICDGVESKQQQNVVFVEMRKSHQFGKRQRMRVSTFFVFFQFWWEKWSFVLSLSFAITFSHLRLLSDIYFLNAFKNFNSPKKNAFHRRERPKR